MAQITRKNKHIQLLEWLTQSWIGIFLLSLIFTLLVMYHYLVPLHSLLHHRDYILQAWDLWWVNESIINLRNPYFTGLQYYPVGAHLGRHVLCLGFFPITFLVWALSGQDVFYPLYAYKLIILISYALILCFSYLTLRELNLPRWASAIPAIAYAFSDFYIQHVHRLHIISGFFIPIIALFLIRLFKKPTMPNALICAVLGAGGFYFTELTLHVYMATFFVVVAMATFSSEGRQILVEKIRVLGAKSIFISVALFWLVASLFVFNWLTSDALPPSPQDVLRHSANLLGFIVPTRLTAPLYGSLFFALNEKMTVGVFGYETFVGFPVLIFGLVAMFTTRQKLVRISALISILFFILSLGPTLKILGTDTNIPMPYSLLASAPPFNIGRTPVRFVSIGLFFGIIVAAYGLQWLQYKVTIKFGRLTAWATMFLIFLWTIAEVYPPNYPYDIYKIPPQLETIDGPVINLPLRYHDPWALLPQIFYNQPTATGYVSRNSRKHEEHFETLRVFYAEALKTGSCKRFEEMGFRNVIIWPGVPDDVVLGLTTTLPHCSISIVDLRR